MLKPMANTTVMPQVLKYKSRHFHQPVHSPASSGNHRPTHMKSGPADIAFHCLKNLRSRHTHARWRSLNRCRTIAVRNRCTRPRGCKCPNMNAQSCTALRLDHYILHRLADSQYKSRRTRVPHMSSLPSPRRTEDLGYRYFATRQDNLSGLSFRSHPAPRKKRDTTSVLA